MKMQANRALSYLVGGFADDWGQADKDGAQAHITLFKVLEQAKPCVGTTSHPQKQALFTRTERLSEHHKRQFREAGLSEELMTILTVTAWTTMLGLPQGCGARKGGLLHPGEGNDEREREREREREDAAVGPGVHSAP